MADAVSERDNSDRRHFKLLLEIQRRVNQERSMARLPGVVMQIVSELMEVDRSTLFLLDSQTMELRACFAQGVEAGKAIVVPLRMGLIGTAILQRRTLNIINAWEHPFFYADIDAVTGYRTDSLLVTPVLDPADGRVLGGLELLNKHSGRFSPADETIAEDAAKWLAPYLAGTPVDAQTIAALVRGDREAVRTVPPH